MNGWKDGLRKILIYDQSIERDYGPVVRQTTE